MRQDKLTTKFQQALADAQSIALGATSLTSRRFMCWRPCFHKMRDRGP